MKFLLFGTFIAICLCTTIENDNFADNEFAEFEVLDENFLTTDSNTVFDKGEKEENGVIELEEKVFQSDDEFAFGEEFESEPEKKVETSEKIIKTDKMLEIKPLTFADIPAHFRSNWSSYQVEAIVLIIIIFYITNYVYGKTRNHTIAYDWFLKNRSLLEKHFALVGDDGVSQEPLGGLLIKETDSSCIIWSSGRVGCYGMLTRIKLQKRQDLLSCSLNILRPKFDRVVHKIELERGEMDSFVIIFGKRKSVVAACKELTDLNTYTIERRNYDRFSGLTQDFAVFAEIVETVGAILDTNTIQFIKKFEKYIEYFHFSDQYSGPCPQEEGISTPPQTKLVLIFSFFHYSDEKEEILDQVYSTLISFMFYIVERIRRYRLSREGKIKADKKRQVIEERYLKTTHLQRQEAAQARREEKTRERKQRVLEEEDPEKQRRLEKMEQKREQKLRQPKMKQIRMK